MPILVYVIYDGDRDGPLDRLAHAIAEGAQKVADTRVVLHRPDEFSVDQLIAADAIVLDSTSMSLDEVVNRMEDEVRRRMK